MYQKVVKASFRDLQYEFKKIERLLRQGEKIQITSRRHVIARLIPDSSGRRYKEAVR